MDYSLDNLKYLEDKFYNKPVKLDPLSDDVTYFSLVIDNIGIEDEHLDFTKQEWLLNYKNESLTKDEQHNILQDLTNATSFEQDIAREFVGQKRFSLEGLESLIPGLNYLFKHTKNSKITLGMAHRGRLNVLTNVFGKHISHIKNEFNHTHIGMLGDVKYHKGYKANINNKICEILPNPSHLESIHAVVLGRAYAIKSLPIIIHGDASTSGQGVVFESLNLAHLKGFNVNGSIHIILDNQIGFTTSKASESRSSKFCSDIFKVIKAPILHVNADDAQACVMAFRLALAYKEKFNEDIVIHLLGYRRFGHNEADDPSLTQPLMYKNIKNHPNAKKIYEEKLGVTLEQKYKDFPLLEDKVQKKSLTKYSKQNLIQNNINLFTIKKDFVPSRIIKKLFNDYINNVDSNNNLAWGQAELLAYCHILQNGHQVRLVGQDSQRGTFSHRHTVIHSEDGQYENILDKFGKCEVLNSSLSEAGVLGFEYGSSLNLDKLHIWEAQFGDFANNAQVIIDQFITSSYEKWGQKSNLVLMLPHGYEGQGPEHSSARIERFLQLSAMNNIRVCYPSTTSQIFHLLISQMLKDKPLIIFTPKRLLRLKEAMSPLNDFINKEDFSTYLITNESKIDNIILCTGKIYYEIIEHVSSNTQVVRLEQLYPLDDITILLDKHKDKKIYWCQEEPKNQGAWYFIKANLDLQLNYIGRPEFSSPAEGDMNNHKKNQDLIIKKIKGI